MGTSLYIKVSDEDAEDVFTSRINQVLDSIAHKIEGTIKPTFRKADTYGAQKRTPMPFETTPNPALANVVSSAAAAEPQPATFTTRSESNTPQNEHFSPAHPLDSSLNHAAGTAAQGHGDIGGGTSGRVVGRGGERHGKSAAAAASPPSTPTMTVPAPGRPWSTTRSGFDQQYQHQPPTPGLDVALAQLTQQQAHTHQQLFSQQVVQLQSQLAQVQQNLAAVQQQQVAALHVQQQQHERQLLLVCLLGVAGAFTFMQLKR